MRSGPAAIRQDKAGRFIVAQRVANEPIMVFQGDGSFVTTVGKIGDGPGEFRRVRGISVVGDTIYLYDEGTQRISFVDSDFKFLGSIPLKGASLRGGLALSPDLHVVNMRTFGGASIGQALHLVDAAGNVVRSIEAADAQSNDPTAHMRLLFHDADGDGFWTVPQFGRITLRRYSAEGDLLAEWLMAASQGDQLPMSYGNPDEDRLPTRQALAAWHEGGLVWIVSSVPEPRWRDGLSRSEDDVHGTSYRPADFGLIFDGAVEVYDAESGELLAAQYSDDVPVAKLVRPGLAARMTTDELGWVYLYVRRAQLIRSDAP